MCDGEYLGQTFIRHALIIDRPSASPLKFVVTVEIPARRAKRRKHHVFRKFPKNLQMVSSGHLGCL